MTRTDPARTRRTAYRLTALATVVAAVAVVAGCTAAGTRLSPQPTHTVPPGVADLSPGFLGDDSAPTPESTINPAAGSWDGVEPPDGYRVVVISRGTDPATATLVDAVRRWAGTRDVDLTELTAADDDQVEERIDEAVADDPDLVVGAGPGVVDVFALITSQYLDQQFLVVGAELAEPTENVTSVIWPGATFRGTGLGSSGEVDDTAITAEQSQQAVSAGVASVLHGLTGIVVNLG